MREKIAVWIKANPAALSLASLALGAVLTASVAGVFLRGESTRRIVRQSPTIQNTCPSFKKVGYPCPKPGSGVKRTPSKSKSTQGLGIGPQDYRDPVITPAPGMHSPPAQANPQPEGRQHPPKPKSPPAVIPPPGLPAAPSTDPSTSPSTVPPVQAPPTPIRDTVQGAKDTAERVVCSLPVHLCP